MPELVFSMYNNGNESKADMLKVHLKASQVFPFHPSCLQMQNTLAEYLFTLLSGHASSFMTSIKALCVEQGRRAPAVLAERH